VAWYFDKSEQVLFEIITQPIFVMRMTRIRDGAQAEFPIDENSLFLFGANPSGDAYKDLIGATIIQRHSKSWLRKLTGSASILKSEILGYGDKKFIDITQLNRLAKIQISSQTLSCELVL